MISCYVEPSGESSPLARAETAAAAEAVGGGLAPDPLALSPLIAVRLPDLPSIGALSARLALARRCLRTVHPGLDPEAAASLEGRDGRSAVFRRVGRSEGSSDAAVRAAGKAYRAGGGVIDLESPERRYWLATSASGDARLLREAAPVDRRASAARAMPRLPFQRPVSLAPRLARAAANLARARPGDRVVDPFLGTGALLAEAALLGATVFGIDRDPTMVRGALANFAHLGVSAAELLEGDAGEVDFADPGLRFAAVLTDPPYGRAARAGREGAAAVWRRVVPRWAERVVPGGRVVAVVPTGFEPLGEPWVPVLAVPVRVHRSLTREFRVYERAP